ncbi:hypothetical protein [Aliiglaciecola aliphaticivorans]
MVCKLGRALVLAVLLCVGGVNLASAHALPGSQLTFSQDGEQLELSLQIALEDLIIADPGFKTLMGEANGHKLSGKNFDHLAAYFEKHIKLAHQSSDLPLTLSSASLKEEMQDHLGTYVLLVSQLMVDIPNGASVFPMTLTYDAVMHEVRNHRATVFWQQHGEANKRIANFGFKPVGGKQQGKLLE